MNLHVIAVHFPIVLLTLYSLLELVRWRKIAGLPYWFYLKAFLVIAGTLSALVTLETGEMLVEGSGMRPPAIVEIHSLVATTTTILFSFISVLYILLWTEKAGCCERYAWLRGQDLLRKIGHIAEHPVMIVFALAGLGAITVTGALGGIIAFGPDTDPLARILYDLLITKLQ